MAAKELIVLTGATGFLGFKVLITALEARYDVRCVVRSPSKIDSILSTPSIKKLNLGNGQLSWATVPDMAAPGAYDEAVQGAKYVVHVASPIPSFGAGEAPTPEAYEEHFVQAAHKGAIGILESIRKAGTVQRVIMTSSIVANIPFNYLIGQGDDAIFNAESRIPFPSGPYGFEFQAYSASKTAQLNASEAWIKDNKPNFDLISILPGWIFGRDELNTKADDFKTGSTNSVLIGLLLGSQSEIPFTGNSVFVDDVAKLHVQALDSKINGNQSFIAASDGINGMTWEDSIKTVKKFFPEAIEGGRLQTTGKQPTKVLHVDMEKTEKTFGIRFASYEQQVKSLVGQYLEVTKA